MKIPQLAASPRYAHSEPHRNGYAKPISAPGTLRAEANIPLLQHIPESRIRMAHLAACVHHAIKTVLKMMPGNGVRTIQNTGNDIVLRGPPGFMLLLAEEMKKDANWQAVSIIIRDDAMMVFNRSAFRAVQELQEFAA